MKVETCLTAFFVVFVLASTGCLNQTASEEVVIYVAHDQDYSEPILKGFEGETGITVKVLYDTETTKTTGLVNKLLAEADRPQADVFWNNEVSRTVMLKQQGVLEPYCAENAEDVPAAYKDPDCYWSGFGARARILLYNTELVNASDAPSSLMDLTDPKWKGRVCMANPLFGSTASHVAALFAYWGDDEAKKYFNDLKANEVKVVESNGRVRDLVVSGECAIGLTDTDDANDAIVEGKAVALVFPDQDGMGTLVFPNTAMLIKDGPNPENGKALIEYLQSREVESLLSHSKAVQIPLKPGVDRPDNVRDSSTIINIPVTQDEIYSKLEVSQLYTQEVFIV